MKKPKDFKTSILLLGSVIAVIVCSILLSSCSSYTCPTYAGINKAKAKPYKNYQHSKSPYITKR